MNKLFYIFALLSSYLQGMSQEKTMITGFLEHHKDLDTVEVLLLDRIDNYLADDYTVKTIARQGHFSLVANISDKQPANFRILSVNGQSSYNLEGFIEAGDRINLRISGDPYNHVTFSGRGSTKLRVIQDVMRRSKLITPPSLNSSATNSYLQYYHAHSAYVNHLQQLALTVIKENTDSLSKDATYLLKHILLFRIEEKRAYNLASLARKAAANGLKIEDLKHLYDTTVVTSAALQIGTNDIIANMSGLSSLNPITRLSASRELDFTGLDSLGESQTYTYISKHFTGLYRDLLLHNVLSPALRKRADNPAVLSLFNEFMAGNHHLAVKNKLLEVYKSSTRLKSGNKAPDFKLIDQFGKHVTKGSLAGKVIFIDFWFTGCAPCAKLVPYIQKIEAHFRDNPDLIFLSISSDTNRKTWLKSIAAKRYTTGFGISVMGGEKGSSKIFQDYLVTGFPRLIIIDKQGNILKAMPPDSKPDTEPEVESIIKLMQSALSND